MRLVAGLASSALLFASCNKDGETAHATATSGVSTSLATLAGEPPGGCPVTCNRCGHCPALLCMCTGFSQRVVSPVVFGQGSFVEIANVGDGSGEAVLSVVSAKGQLGLLTPHEAEIALHMITSARAVTRQTKRTQQRGGKFIRTSGYPIRSAQRSRHRPA